MIEQTKFAELVDCPDKEFSEYLEDKNVGYVQSLRNFISANYQVFTEMRRDLVEKISAENLSQDSEEYKTLQGIYVEMMKLEQKATICVEWIKSHSIEQGILT